MALTMTSVRSPFVAAAPVARISTRITSVRAAPIHARRAFVVRAVRILTLYGMLKGIERAHRHCKSIPVSVFILRDGPHPGHVLYLNGYHAD